MISYRTSKFNSTHEFKSSDTMGAFYLENTIANLLSNKLLFLTHLLRHCFICIGLKEMIFRL